MTYKNVLLLLNLIFLWNWCDKKIRIFFYCIAFWKCVIVFFELFLPYLFQSFWHLLINQTVNQIISQSPYVSINQWVVSPSGIRVCERGGRLHFEWGRAEIPGGSTSTCWRWGTRGDHSREGKLICVQELSAFGKIYCGIVFLQISSV